jgi:hypothetical protein
MRPTLPMAVTCSPRLALITRNAVGTPSRRPWRSTAAPPELPPVMAASVRMKARLAVPPCSPVQPDTSPADTWMELAPPPG